MGFKIQNDRNEDYLKFIDICAGIGGFRSGLEKSGHECVGFVEYDKYAVKSYRAMYKTEGEFYHDDITTIKSEDIPRADAWCFGFPCQDISIAGKQRGLKGSRSGIYFDILNLVKSKKEEDKPRWLLIENVKNLLSIDGGWGFARVLSELDEAGYDVQWQLLNSKNFGVPQNRERVFIVGNLRGRGGGKIFPIAGQSNKNSTVGKSTETAVARTFTAGGHSAENHSGMTIIQIDKFGIDKSCNAPKEIDIANCITSREDRGVSNRKSEGTAVVIPVLTPFRKEKKQNGRRFKEDGDPAFTITSQDRHGVMISELKYIGGIESNKRIDDENNLSRNFKEGYRVYDPEGIACCQKTNGGGLGGNTGLYKEGLRIRKLTPKECFRLQGFTDEQFEKATNVNSNSQLYKQAGNAVTVNVVYEIGKILKNIEISEIDALGMAI